MASVPPRSPGPFWRRWLLHPLPWLGLQIVVSLLLLAGGASGLEPQRVPDTVSYIEASRLDTAAEVLSHYRTFGYPLLLRLVNNGANNFPDRWVWVPRIHLICYFGAVLLWWLAVRRFSGSRWLAFAAATPLPWASVMPLFSNVQPDFLAAAFVIAAMALLLLTIERPRSVGLWAALGVVVFFGYQLRPAGVFLIGLLPALGVCLALGVKRLSWRRAVLLSAGLALATGGPFLAFAGVRSTVVGHFGLVSFGGLNLSGMASCFIGPEMVSELPPSDQMLAQGIAATRARRGWLPMTADDDPRPWFRQYSDNIWHVALQAVRAESLRRERGRARSGQPPPDPRPQRVIWNERLNDFSREVISRRPELYRNWMLAAVLYGLQQLPQDPWVLWPAVLLALSLPATWLLRPRRLGGPWRPALGLALIALAYFSGYLLLVATVSYPFERYFASITLFLPGALCALLYALWSPRSPENPPPEVSVSSARTYEEAP